MLAARLFLSSFKVCVCVCVQVVCVWCVCGVCVCVVCVCVVCMCVCVFMSNSLNNACVYSCGMSGCRSHLL